jgi:hypothetical protein
MEGARDSTEARQMDRVHRLGICARDFAKSCIQAIKRATARMARLGRNKQLRERPQGCFNWDVAEAHK